MTRGMIAMSGGVDSSVAAYLMKKEGFDCVGVTMKLFTNTDIGAERDDVCCSLKDTDDARSVAYRLGISHYVFNFAEDFKREVIERFVEAYENGLTPNPCVECNRRVKFERLLDRARQMEYSFVITGHYARVERSGGQFLLKKALDGAKDQSYFLYSLTQEQLAHTLFPLGGMRKQEVREIALEQGFVNAQKRESQDICFVTSDYASFIEQYRSKRCNPGDFVDAEGKILGRHKGLLRYTLGQRKGLGISSTHRLYVCGKSATDNTVTLGEEKALYARVFFAEKLSWIAGAAPIGRESIRMRLKAKTGYRRPEQWAAVESIGDEKIRVEFDEPQRRAASGQALVLYDGDVVVGGGTIAE
jgi:tRNA-specific 2-thiouridylase